MLNLLLSDPISFIVGAAALLLAITVHEFAHAFAADKLGDPTPRLQDRLTLNPIAHLDPIGTVMLILVGFGWGKPVQFDPYNLENPRKDSAIISIAGPISNLLLALILSLILKYAAPMAGNLISPFIYLNVLLAVFNLLPIHPLDGGKILVGLLPREDAYRVDKFLRQYGMYILLLMILPIWGGQSPVFTLLNPIINLILSLLLPGSNFV